MNLGDGNHLSSLLHCTYLPNLCFYKRPATLALTNKDMSVCLLWQLRSSVISAGFKYSRETHTSETVQGRGLWCFCCTCVIYVMMGVNSCLVTVFLTFKHFCRKKLKKYYICILYSTVSNNVI